MPLFTDLDLANEMAYSLRCLRVVRNDMEGAMINLEPLRISSADWISSLSFVIQV
jgi:hypothetical protein